MAVGGRTGSLHSRSWQSLCPTSRPGVAVADEIPLGRPTVGAPELEAVRQVFESGWLAGQGPASRSFEAAFADRVGSPHALAVNNCTAGLHLALAGLGVGAGDEVIVADYTYPATAHAVAFCGATPRFADVHRETGLVDVDSVASLVGDRTVGIVAVDGFGQPADYRELWDLAGRSSLFLVEDAACSAGATYRGSPTGSPELADAAAFSLHGRKGITAGEGGVVVTARDELAAFVRSRMCFGVESALDRAASAGLAVPVFAELGWNYKLSDVAAAVAEAQLGRLETLVERRAKVAAAYDALLVDAEGITGPVELDDRTHSWQSYVVLLAPEVDRGAVATRLRSEGIGCNIGTFACHVQPVYRSSDVCPVSAELFDRHLAIPMHAELDDDQVVRVAGALRSAVVETLLH